jgi:hypothetical protein
MERLLFSHLAVVALAQFILGIALTPPSLVQEWGAAKPKGTIKY